MLFLLLSCLVLGTVFLLMVYALPVERMRENISSSLDVLMHEGNYYSWAGFKLPHAHIKTAGSSSVPVKEKLARMKAYSILDRFTDAIMLNIAVYSNDKENTMIHDAMMNPRIEYEVSQDKIEYLSRVITAGTNEGGKVVNYPRYWHGYLVYLKPFLMLASVPVIRIINFVVQFLLLVLVMIKMSGKIGSAYAFAFAIAVLVIDPIAAAECFQYYNVYYIVLAMMIIMLNHNDALKKRDGYYILFAAGGIFAAYFDLLTYPFASLGIPTVLYLLMNDRMKLAEKLSAMIKTGLSWGFGYSGMWAGKWILSSLITGDDVIGNALAAASMRLNGASKGVTVTWYEKLREFFSYLVTLHGFWIIVILLCITAALIVLYLCLSVRKGKTTAAEIIPLCFAFLYTFVWYGVLQNHTIVHFLLFTHKLLSVSVFAALCVLIKCSGYKHDG